MAENDDFDSNNDSNGTVALYGVAIGYALEKGDVATSELLELRKRARALISDQGNLVDALIALEGEISKREDTPASVIAGSGEDIQSEKFVIYLPTIGLQPDVREHIQVQLQNVVLNELAKIDTGGSLKATPLSEIKFWGDGYGGGGTTAGMIIDRL